MNPVALEHLGENDKNYHNVFKHMVLSYGFEYNDLGSEVYYIDGSGNKKLIGKCKDSNEAQAVYNKLRDLFIKKQNKLGRIFVGWDENHLISEDEISFDEYKENNESKN